jgi:hypothetical protein
MMEKTGLWFWEDDEEVEFVLVLEPQSLINIRWRIAKDKANERFQKRFEQS